MQSRLIGNRSACLTNVRCFPDAGRFGNGQGQEFAEHFLIEYWRDSLGKWVRYKDVKGEEVITFRCSSLLANKESRLQFIR